MTHDDVRAEVYREFGHGLVPETVLRYLPEGGAVVDVGCASGGLIQLLRHRAGRLVGVEINEVSANEARAVADEVVTASIDEVAFADEFDVAVCADVLEHIADPLAALRRVAGWVKPGGHVVVSVPNVGHFSARLRIARGRWGYDPDGIFDETHLRFFTVDTAADLVRNAGLDVISRDVTVPAFRNVWGAIERAPRAAHRVEKVWQRIGARRPNLMGYQTVVVGQKASLA